MNQTSNKEINLNSRQMEAVGNILNAATEKQDQALRHCWLGEACFNLSCFPEAIAAYTESLRLDPEDHGITHYQLALSYYKSQRFAEAIQHIEKMLTLSPGAPDA